MGVEPKFMLNPFATVIQTGGEFFINSTDQYRVRFAGRDRPFVERLMSGESLGVEDLRPYIALSRMRELQRKRILLPIDLVPPEHGRYSRQQGFFSLMRGSNLHVQLTTADVLVLGAGAIGSHVLWNLAAMGVGRITVVDFDTVEETNLNRQLMYSCEDIGQIKVDVLCAKTARFNPGIELTPVNQKIGSPRDIEKLVIGKVLVVKAIDTPEHATYWVNEVCVKHGIPFIAGGFMDCTGVVGPIYVPGKSVCAACMGIVDYKRVHGIGASFAPLTTVVSSAISMCAFRLLTGLSDSLVNKMFMYDTPTGEWTTTLVKQTDRCSVCDRMPDRETPIRDRTNLALWAYRAAIVFVMALVSVFRIATHTQAVGLIAMCILFMSAPVLDMLCDHKPTETRRQIFVISCIYGLLSAVFTFSRSTFSAAGHGFDRVFYVVQVASSEVVAVAVLITVLFFVQSVIVHLGNKLR